jgi:hypothetical protein
MKEGRLSNEQMQLAARKREKLKERMRNDDLTFVLGSPQGRRFFWDVLDRRAGTFSGSFTGNSQTFFNEGRRSVGIELMADAQQLAPELYGLALQEQLKATAEESLLLRQPEEKTDA